MAVSDHALHTIAWNDTHFGSNPPQFLIIHFRSHKHSSSTHNLAIPASASFSCCPVASLLAFLKLRSAQAGPIFLSADGIPATRSWFASQLKSCLALADLAPSVYSTHLFRITRATDLATEGRSDRTIKTTGRWSSNVVRLYMRPSIVTPPSWVSLSLPPFFWE